MSNGLTPRHDELVNALADGYRIAVGHTSNSGEHITYPQSDRMAVLREADFPCDTEEEAEASLDRMRRDYWTTPIGPVKVAIVDELPFTVDLRVPEGATHFSYVLRLENGESRSGRWTVKELSISESIVLDGTTFHRYDFTLPDKDLPQGIHSLEVVVYRDGDTAAEGTTPVYICPNHCYQGPTGRGIVASCLASALRGPDDWGRADGATLRTATRELAELGADGVFYGPLWVVEPQLYGLQGVYMGFSKRFYDPRLINPADAARRLNLTGFLEDIEAPGFRGRLAALRGAGCVQHLSSDLLKFRELKNLHAAFRTTSEETHSEEQRAFKRFVKQGGWKLRQFTITCAIREVKFPPAAGMGDLWNFENWDELAHPERDELERFAAEHEEVVDFYLFTQWQAKREVELIADLCRELNMPLGLMNSIPLGLQTAAYDRYANQRGYIPRVKGGSPGDAFKWDGQVWDLAPRCPYVERQQAYKFLVEDTEAAMEDAGAAEGDHGMAYFRFYVVRPGGTGRDGVYVLYHEEEILPIVALLSQRNKCRVVLEFLGTIPENSQELVRRWGIYVFRQVRFEQHWGEGRFVPPQEYWENSWVIGTNHNLPPELGWFLGRDAEIKFELGMINDEERDGEHEVRAREAAAKLEILKEQGLLSPEEVDALLALRQEIGRPISEEQLEYLIEEPLCQRFLEAHVRLMARTRSKEDCQHDRGAVMMLDLNETAGDTEPDNVPGSGENDRPNWRRRTLRADQLSKHPHIRRAFEAAVEERTPAQE